MADGSGHPQARTPKHEPSDIGERTEQLSGAPPHVLTKKGIDYRLCALVIVRSPTRTRRHILNLLVVSSVPLALFHERTQNHQYKFPPISVCLEDSAGCGYADGSVETCVESALWWGSYAEVYDGQLYESSSQSYQSSYQGSEYISGSQDEVGSASFVCACQGNFPCADTLGQEHSRSRERTSPYPPQPSRVFRYSDKNTNTAPTE